jgi:hypothetical protein
MIFLVLFTFTSLQRPANFFTETNTTWNLDNSTMSITISKTSGEITAIIIKDKNIISHQCAIDFSSAEQSENGIVIRTNVNNQSPRYCQVIIEKKYPNKSVVCEYTMDTISLYWKISATSTLNIDREFKIDFSLPLIKDMQYMFTPSEHMSVSLDDSKIHSIIYRRDVTIPMVTLYNVAADYGLSIVTPLEIQKPDLSFQTNSTDLIVSFSHLRLANEKTVQAAIYLVAHDGDWRPGLDFLLHRYPNYFYPVAENTKHGEGWYIQGSVHDKKDKMKKSAANGVSWIEFHYYFPFYGLYTPRSPRWGLIADSDEVSLLDWERGAGKNQTSYAHINNLIDLWHTYGIQVYLYFQSFEAWHHYADRYFPHDIARDKYNSPYPAWKFTHLMNPDPMSAWGQSIIQQARELVKKFPDIDGIFYDRMDYWKYDFAHSDKVTMINDQSAYMLGFAQEKINDILFDIFHKNQKGIWGNGPTSIEACKNIDGIMAETHVSALNKIQYLGLVRPIIFLPYDRTPKETEHKLKNTLLCGAFPSVTYGDTLCQRLDEKYRPLFSLIKNRTWVLTKNPVVISTQFKSNIFQTPEGDYVVVVISPEKSQLIPHPFEYNIPVTINIPNAEDLTFANLLSGDWQGVNTIDFKKNDNTFVIHLPYHLSSSLIYISKKKHYEIVRLSSPVLVRGTTENLVFRINALGRDNSPTITVETPWQKLTTTPRGNLVTIQTAVPKDSTGEVDITINYNDKSFHFTSWIVGPISVAPVEDIFIHNTAGERIPLYFVNNLEENVSFNTQGKFINRDGSVVLPNRIFLQALETKIIEALITSKTNGPIQIITTLDTESIENFFPVKTSLLFTKNDLFHDNFSQGMIQWAIERGAWTVSHDIATGRGPSHFAFIKNKAWRDYVCEVQTRCRGSTVPEVNWLKSYIFFRVQDEKNFYRFGIHGDNGVIDLYRCVDGTWLRIAASPFIPKKDTWYALRIQVRGPEITGYLNGEKILESHDRTFLQGGIGLGVLEDNMVCDYRNVVVKGIQ